MQSSCSQV